MQIFENIFELIGKTPLLKLNNFKDEYHLYTNVYAKLEMYNPGGSIKDRAAYQIIKDALENNLINKETTIVEPTSGNTGIGLALIASVLKMKLILTMPETMSIERRAMLKAYGAEIILTPGSEGMTGAIKAAKDFVASHKNAYMPSQFDNQSNAKAHYLTTGPEIWKDTDGKLDFLIATVGTGGTLSGTAQYLKEQNPKIKIIAVEPFSSPVLSGGKAGPHGIQGIGAGFVPSILNRDLIDEVITIKDDEAYKMGAKICRLEGVFCGISAGAALCAALKLGQDPQNKGKISAVIIPDSGDRYLSTPMFN
ncbi:cysteine synthase A [uncultured Succinatimonas sp.]|uniref:cysteine synthase A n=1 Tax=uncultured Succinatimonas sp. TaxID=1262973 RepID=UPI0025FB7456|nr:cysteine synthase A [uncultured Succinatimonas sp.]